MRFRWNPWALAIAVVLLCGGVFWFIRWKRLESEPTVADLLKRLPQRNAITVHADFATLRQAGLIEVLAGSSALEEPDYRRFVTETGFDWRTDLDSVTAATVEGRWYWFASGRFDMAKLNAYATSRGGSCRNGVCDMPGATPGRRVSFFPLSTRTLAMATANTPLEVYALMQPSVEWARIPPEVVWVSFPGEVLASRQEVPSGSRLFAKALADARRVTFVLQPSLNGITLEMRAETAGPESAVALHSQLEGVTREFQKYFDRLGQKANPNDLSGLLLSGQFKRENQLVVGRWPVQRTFLENLASGSL